MKKFSEHLTEGVKKWTVADFKACIESTRTLESMDTARGASMRDRYLPYLIDSLNEFPTGDIPNPTYNEIKRVANLVVEIATKFPAWLYADIRSGKSSVSSWNWDVAGMHNVPGKLKAAQDLLRRGTNESHEQFLGWLIPILTELAPVAEIVKGMKARAVKRVVKTDAEKSSEKKAFISSFASADTTKAVWDGLKHMTDELKPPYAAGLVKWWTDLADRYANMTPEQRDIMRKQNQYRAPFIATLPIWTPRTSTTDPYRLKSDFKTVLKKVAQEAADAMQEQFLFKNVAKLRAIIEMKGVSLIGTPKVINLSTAQGMFTGEMDISFKDGASFRVRNKVVLKQNSYGTVFNQFPTTFHNVKLPDGKTMPSPSEERMQTVFAKVKK